MNRHQLRSVRKRSFNLDLLQHLRHALHDLLTMKEMDPLRHELGDALAIPNPFKDLRSDQGQRLGVVQLEAARSPPPRHFSGGEDQQLLLLTRRQMHSGLPRNGMISQEAITDSETCARERYTPRRPAHSDPPRGRP